ncbi:glycosyltransferase family 4 protein [Streptomyces luomodiensis]|uniref:D-inositol 3-phosphate glycosyltransferase n=1 Tax=Streptomyces luomodiensis TaxID=3026192 RepID=A0ABY9V774_9ACTN|nr:glycosyltransferase family 4 protein [Streptomyces sp. SCA4-21]WNE99749.1 glycosyltransferase family 4 protein [Streptomyces sp. SCA4-21]
MMIRYLLLHAYGMGGTIRTVFNQASAMAAAGHEVEIVSARRGRTEPRFPLDPRVRLVPLVDEREREKSGAGAGPAGEDSPFAWLRSRRTRSAREHRPAYVPAGEFGAQFFTPEVERAVIRHLRGLDDGVLVSTRPGLNLLAARFAPRHLPLVAQEHMNLRSHRRDVQAAIARTYGRFDIIAVLTEGDREAYEQTLPGARVVCVPNAVHKPPRQAGNYPAHIAVAAGRLLPQKGFDLLIPAFGRALEHHPDWQLRIYGSGPQHTALRNLIDEHHLYNNVFLMGHTSDLDGELTKASLYVLSSRFEGLPMVMIEAMALGLPIVSFDCPTGPRDVLTDGKDGFLVPPGDTAALAGALTRLMDDEGRRADMGAAALDSARAYAPDSIQPRWQRLFETLHPASRGARPGRPA